MERPVGSDRVAATRSAGAIAVAVALAAILLSSCSGSGATPNRSSATQRDAAAVAAAVTTYFVDGIGRGDWGAASRSSTGPLRTAADWLGAQGIANSESERGTLSITSMVVSSVNGREASVSLEAEQRGENYSVTYTGPVSVVKAADGWKVADYLRDGRSVAAGVFTSAHGQASHKGVTVKVVGAQLEAGHVDVWVQISNATAATLVWNRPIVIVDRSGQQLGRGFLFVSSADASDPFVMLPHLSAFGDFLVDSVTQPLSTRSFRLLVGATDQSTHTPIDLGVQVKLG